MNRRNFLNNFSRYALLGGLGSLLGFLVVDRKIVAVEDCSVSQVCRMCGKFRSCDKVAELKSTENGKTS